MSPFLQAIGWIAAFVCAVVVVRHHLGYYRRRRPLSFGAFVETGGWIILLLVVLRALAQGMAEVGARIVGVAATAVGFLFIGIGSLLR